MTGTDGNATFKLKRLPKVLLLASVTRTVNEKEPAASSIPLMIPVAVLIARPVGRPVADQV